MNHRRLRFPLLLPLFVAVVSIPPAVSADEKSLAESIRRLEPHVLAVEGKATKEQRDELRRMLSADVRARRRKVNEADVKLWRSVDSVEAWERMRDERIAALRKSLGTFPDPPKDLKVRITKTIPGDGFAIENIVFQSRPGLWVTANLYRPDKPGKKAPGILICHSHHRPKTHGELQDMGMIWARAGCCVLVMDQLGHGERGAHPFRSVKDFAKSFRVSRQDYFFRYNTGVQLNLLGDGLVGWMAWDLQRGVDLLLSRPDVDPERIILLGAVAGGGDPCAVTAAIDQRIAAAVPFNFGGPQPENVFPLPEDADVSFNYVGGGSWESTRNLRLSARDGFLPWVIVGSIAPRRLVYAHEFRWDEQRDPVWKRFQTLYKWYGKPERLASVKGYGRVSLPSSKASHCTNIGSHHRKAGIYAAFEKWFGIPAPKDEFRGRLPESQLLCTKGAPGADDVKLTPLHEVAGKVADERIAAMRRRLRAAPPEERRAMLQSAWKDVLGDVEPAKPADRSPEVVVNGGMKSIRYVLEPSPGIRVPLIVLLPADQAKTHPVVVCVSQSGKATFLKERAGVVAKFLQAGVAVCIPDLRGCGETRSGTYRGRRSNDTGLSSSELMLGGTSVGSRLKDLRSVLALLRSWETIDGKRLAVWGDSFAEINPPDRNVGVPLELSQPPHSEPLGHLLVLLTTLFEDDVKAGVSNRGGLDSYRSVLNGPFVHLPHDAVVPGAIAAGDLPLLATAAAGSTPLWLAEMVDGENKPASAAKEYEAASTTILDKSDSNAAADWLIERLR